MRLRKIVLFFWVLLVLAGCGGGSIVLDNFLPMTKTEGDSAFVLTAPSSKSPAAFTYTSSDPTVATISANTVTILLAGTTTITAEQPGLGSFSPTSATAVLTVLPRTCTAPAVRGVNGVCVTAAAACVAPTTLQGGVCVAPPAACTAPSSLQNGVCTAPVPGAGTSNVVRNGTTWAPVERIDSWTNANAYCNTTTIGGLAGWRLPSEFELKDLYASSLAVGHGWMLSETWSSTPFNPFNLSTSIIYWNVVDLSTGRSNGTTDATGAYVSCVRSSTAG